jgi:NAD(P)H-nitrite reductase large subunit
VRIREGTDLVKLIVLREAGAEGCRQQRVVGAVLVGDTGLEEAVENLILDRTDVSRFGPSLLDPEADLEGYFD